MDSEKESGGGSDLRETIASAVERQRENFQVDAGPQIAPKGPEAPEATEAPIEPGKEASRDDGRDQKGRFSQKGEDKGNSEIPEAQEEEPEAAVRQEVKGKEVTRDVTKPPRRMPVRTKAGWERLPYDLREDIIMREEEFDKSFKKYDGLGNFAMEAERNGTSLSAAVADYSAVEGALRKDPRAGLDFVAQKMNWNPKALAYAYAVHHGIISPAEGDQSSSQPQQAPPSNGFDPSATRAEVEKMLAQRDADSQIKEFADNPKNTYYTNVKPAMAALLNSGEAMTLQDAYDQACWKSSEIRPFLISGKAAQPDPNIAAANRARAANKAVGGPPAHGSNAPAKPRDSTLSIHDAVKSALARQRGEA